MKNDDKNQGSSTNTDNSNAFLITNVEGDKLPGYDRAIFVPKAAGRAVCLSEPDFKFLVSEQKFAAECTKAYSSTVREQSAFDWTSFGLGAGAGGAIALILTIFIHK